MTAADAASRTYTVKIDLPANPGLKSGLYGLARFPVAQKEAITIPQTAIAQRGQLSGVFVVNAEGIVQMRIVTTGNLDPYARPSSGWGDAGPVDPWQPPSTLAQTTK